MPAAPPWLGGANASTPQSDNVESDRDDPTPTDAAPTPEPTDHTEVFSAVSENGESPHPAPPEATPQVPQAPPQWDQGPPGPPPWDNQPPPPPPQWNQGPPGPPPWDNQPPPPAPQWNQGPPGPPPWGNQGPPPQQQWDQRAAPGPGPRHQPGPPPPHWDNQGRQFPPGAQFAPPPGPDPRHQQQGPPPQWQGRDAPPQQLGRQGEGPPGQFNQAQFNQAPPGYGPPHMPGQLDSQALLRKARRAPQAGWRRTVHRISGGNLNPGDSRDTVYFDQLVHKLNAPIRGDFRIAVLSLKGGVGKTTTTIGLGSTFSHLRGDRVIAVDANPDLGTLAQRVPQQSMSTVRDVLNDDSIFRYSDIRAHTSQAPSRLEVLGSERDPAVAETFGEQDYRSVMRVLQRFYNIILTDCGTGLSHSAMNGVLDLANALILVSTPAIDGARSASATLDWLQAHGYGYLVSRAIVVLSGPRRGTTTVNLDQLAQHFLARTRAVQIVPYDQHLAEGADIDLELLDRATRRAFVELAATVAEDFAVTTRQE